MRGSSNRGRGERGDEIENVKGCKGRDLGGKDQIWAEERERERRYRPIATLISQLDSPAC